MTTYQSAGQELGVYNTGGDQWEVLTEEEAISRGLLNTDRGLSQNQKIAIGVTTAAAVAAGGYLLYKYFNKQTGRETTEVLSEEEAATKGLSLANGKKIIIGAAASAAVAYGGYFLYRYYNPQTGREEQRMLTDVEARGFGLSNAHKVQGGGAPPVVQGQYAPHMQQQQPAYGQQPQYGQQPYNPAHSAPPAYGQQAYNPAQSAPPAYGQPQYGQQPYNPAQSMPMQGQIPTQSFNAYGQQPQYPPQQQQSSGNDAQYGQDAGLRKEFDMLDVNKTGYIDKSDLQTLFMGKVSGTMLKMAIKYVDKDKDGKIGFDEYKKIRSKLKI